MLCTHIVYPCSVICHHWDTVLSYVIYLHVLFVQLNFVIAKINYYYTYLSVPKKMHLPSAQDLAHLIHQSGKGAYLYSCNSVQAYRQLPLDWWDVAPSKAEATTHFSTMQATLRHLSINKAEKQSQPTLTGYDLAGPSV